MAHPEVLGRHGFGGGDVIQPSTSSVHLVCHHQHQVPKSHLVVSFQVSKPKATLNVLISLATVSCLSSLFSSYDTDYLYFKYLKKIMTLIDYKLRGNKSLICLPYPHSPECSTVDAWVFSNYLLNESMASRVTVSSPLSDFEESSITCYCTIPSSQHLLSKN